MKNERLCTPQDWVDFAHEAFVPYCVDAFSTESLRSWCQKKLVIPSLPISGMGKRAVPDKGKEDGGTVAYLDLLAPTPKIGSGGIRASSDTNATGTLC